MQLRHSSSWHKQRPCHGVFTLKIGQTSPNSEKQPAKITPTPPRMDIFAAPAKPPEGRIYFPCFRVVIPAKAGLVATMKPNPVVKPEDRGRQHADLHPSKNQSPPPKWDSFLGSSGQRCRMPWWRVCWWDCGRDLPSPFARAWRGLNVWRWSPYPHRSGPRSTFFAARTAPPHPVRPSCLRASESPQSFIEICSGIVQICLWPQQHAQPHEL